MRTLKPRLQTQKSQEVTIDANSWRTDKTTSQRGYGSAWQRYRLDYLARHPLCVYCAKKQRTTPAQVVDHIAPHRGDMKLFWDGANHQALCKTCHDSTKQREENRR